MTYYESRGTQTERPLEVDTVSSPSTVYLRKNIRQETETTEQGEVTFWVYEEAALTREEYEEYTMMQEANEGTRQILDALLGGAA